MAELLDDTVLRCMTTDVGMARLRSTALELVELRAELAEHTRLHKELNAIIHPKAEGPECPSLCDLVAFVRADMRELAVNRLAVEAKIQALRITPETVVVIQADRIDRDTWVALQRVISSQFPPSTKVIVCSTSMSISALPPEELAKVGLVSTAIRPIRTNNTAH